MNKHVRAGQYVKEGKLKEAATLLHEVIKDNPKDPTGYINIGNLLLQANDYDRANDFFNQAIQLDSKAATAYYGIGNLFYKTGDYVKAQQYFLQAIQLGLHESDVYYMLGMTLQNQEKFKLALPYLMRAVELSNKEDDEVLFQYGLALAQTGNLEEAKTVFHSVIKLNEQHSDAYYNLGVIEMYFDRTDQALDHFNQALNIQPNHLLAANGKKKIVVHE